MSLKNIRSKQTFEFIIDTTIINQINCNLSTRCNMTCILYYL